MASKYKDDEHVAVVRFILGNPVVMNCESPHTTQQSFYSQSTIKIYGPREHIAKSLVATFLLHQR